MKTSTDLIIDAIEAITRVGGSPRTLMTMPLSEVIVSLHKNGLHITLVDVTKKTAKVDAVWISNIGRSKDGHPENLSPYTIIEVRYRNGLFNKGCADDWNLSWNEVKNNSDYVIVAYRTLKD